MVDGKMQGRLVVSCLLACILLQYKYCYCIGVPVFIVVVSFAGRVDYQHHQARSVEPLGTACVGSISCGDLYSNNYISQGQHRIYQWFQEIQVLSKVLRIWWILQL